MFLSFRYRPQTRIRSRANRVRSKFIVVDVFQKSKKIPLSPSPLLPSPPPAPFPPPPDSERRLRIIGVIGVLIAQQRSSPIAMKKDEDYINIYIFSSISLRPADPPSHY